MGTPFLFVADADMRAAGGLDIPAAMADLRMALALWRDGMAEMPAENSVTLGEASLARAYALPARLGGNVQWAGVKWTAHRPALGDGAPAVVSVTMVNDAMTGLPIGIVESALLTATRTAAVSALVLQHAASASLRRVTVLGAGVQAATHLRMLAALFPDLHAVTLWNRTPSRARALAACQEYPWPVSVSEGLAEALADADAVITCTAASVPILDESVMRPGRIVLQVGYHEVSFDAIDRADVVLVDLWGEFRLTSAKSLFQMHRAGRFAQTRVAADLAALVLDGWHPPAQACVYFSSFGLNVFDVALAGRVLRDAAAMKRGTALTLAGPRCQDVGCNPLWDCTTNTTP
jgi:ornithine cyclodeaminase